MEKTLTSIKKFKGTRVIRGKKIPRSIGKVRDVVFFPNKKQVAGFITKRLDFLLMFKRKGRFIPINAYYMYEDYAFVRNQKGSLDKAAYKALGLDPGDCVCWMDLPVVTEEGENVGVITDVTFVHFTGEVHSIRVSQGTVGKVLQSARTIPANLIITYNENASTELSQKEGASKDTQLPPFAIIVSNEALDIEVDGGVVKQAGKQVSKIASSAGVDTAAVSEKAKSAAEVAGSLAKEGAIATGKQLKKTKGMFSNFKDEFNKARKSTD